MKLTLEESDIFDALVMEGDGFMEALGHERQEDGRFRPEDEEKMLSLVLENGLGWARKLVLARKNARMARELTEYELELVEERLADLFVHECHNVAKDLGIEGQPDGTYSDEDAALINAEFDRRYKQGFIDDVLANDPLGDA